MLLTNRLTDMAMKQYLRHNGGDNNIVLLLVLVEWRTLCWCLCIWHVQLSVERLSNDIKLLHILENYARKPIYNNIYINLVSFFLLTSLLKCYNLPSITEESLQ